MKSLPDKAPSRQAITQMLLTHGYAIGYSEAYMRNVAADFLLENGGFGFTARKYKDLDRNEVGVVLVKGDKLPQGFMWVRHPHNKQKMIIKKGVLSASLSHLEICYDQHSFSQDRPAQTQD